MSERLKPEKHRSPKAPPDDIPSPIDAFERAMADVVRIPPDPRGRVRKVAPITTTRPAHEPVTQAAGSPADDFVAPGVDRREIRKLRRGDYAVQNRLDLHGLSVPEACARVHRFIENSCHARHRCVCIVYGRGLNSAGGLSLLRGPVRERLTRNPWVLAFALAPASDGGAGALYVLLRRAT